MSSHSPDQPILARRDFLKTGGVVVVAFSIAGKLRVAAQSAVPPDRNSVDAWIAIHPDNTATLHAGYVELGQGGPTALLQIAAEELDLDFEQINAAITDTQTSTEGLTLASRTGPIGGNETRAAAAEARRVLLELAAERLDATVGELATAKGVVSVRGDSRRSVTYAELVGGKSFDRTFEQFTYQGGIQQPRKNADHATPKPRDSYRLVGSRVARPDIAEKIRGTYEYAHHVRLPGMLHGRVVWPRGQGAHGISNPTVVRIDESSIADIPGARVVRRNNFVGVVAEREWDVVRAASRLKVEWQPFAKQLPGHEGLFDALRSAPTNDVIDTDEGDVDAALARAAHSVSATYRGPYHSHGAMAPNCAVADVTADAALVICSSQSVFLTRFGLAPLLGLPLDKIRVRYAAGSNTYGNSCYGEAANAAAILSQEAGKPVRLLLSRADELGWDNYGPALLSDVRAGVDSQGKLVALDYRAWSHATAWFETASQLALGTPPPTTGYGAPAPGPGRAGLFSVHLSQTDMYDVASRRIVNHVVTGAGFLRTGALRAPMDPSTFFALEGVLDELAHIANVDPYEFRKRNISHPRWLAVLDAAAGAAKWTPRVAASQRSNARVVTGRGIGVGTHHLPQNQSDRITFAAAVVDIEVNKDTGVVIAKNICGAMDCGLAINPGIVESQIVGMCVHGASLALCEEVQFDDTHVTSVDWASYRTLRFAEHPNVTPILLQRIDEPSSGAGEEVLPAVVAAIGNAFFDATGIRLRQYPLMPSRVLAALSSAASARA